MTVVRVVLADPRSGRVPAGSAVNGQQLIVLADDAGQRAVPLWLGVVDAKLLLALPALLERPAGDAVMAGALEETAARLRLSRLSPRLVDWLGPLLSAVLPAGG